MTVRILWVLLLAAALLASVPSGAGAQPAQEEVPAAGTRQSDQSRIWIVAGGSWTVLQGDCRTCSHTSPSRHTGSVVSTIGFRVNRGMDAGAEVFWIPSGSEPEQRMRTTSISAVAQFRPWTSSGFFVNGGMGMAFVRNWAYDDEPPVTGKALAMVISAGWAFRRDRRVGFEVFGSQRAIAIGDLSTAEGTVENVVGNYWSAGAAVVFR